MSRLPKKSGGSFGVSEQVRLLNAEWDARHFAERIHLARLWADEHKARE
jgi:hypothetical protein